jgi:Domain of unknown function (DUF4129)
MTGSTTTSWTFVSRVTIPAVMVTAEATWFSLLVNGVVNTSRGPHVSLPFLALALPAVAATAVSACSGRPGWRRWQQGIALVVVVLACAMVTAGLISLLTRSGSFWRVATQPWTADGQRAAVTAGAVWFFSACAWIRGTWLGVKLPSLRHAAWSFGLGAVAFIGIIVGRADAHTGAFRSVTGPTGWLLFVWFVFAVVAAALVRQRDFEQQFLDHSGSRPSSVWFTVLAVPMLAVALVALLLAVIVGPGAPVIGRIVARGAWALWWVLWWVLTHTFGSLWHLVRHGHSTTSTRHVRLTPHSAPRPLHFTPGHVPPIAAEVVSGVIIVVLVILAVRYLRPHRRLRMDAADRADLAEDEERDSVFTWHHFVTQLWRGVRALLSRFRRNRINRHAAPGAQPAPILSDAGLETVRHAYRRMLKAARSSGQGRSGAETTGEFRGRLSRGPAVSAGNALAELTDIYEAARYGELEITEPARQHAVAMADSIHSALTQFSVQDAAGPPSQQR